MNAYNKSHESFEVSGILMDCEVLKPQDEEVLNHPLIQHFGSPQKPVYMFKDEISINDVPYKKPIVLRLHNAELVVIQLAILQNGQQVRFSEGGIANGFAYYGNLRKDQPVIITYELEAFFKIAQTGYAVVLVVLATLCKQHLMELTTFNFEQITFVINQLEKAGYSQLYIPVRPENIQLEAFQQLTQSTSVKLLNQYLNIGQNEFFIELSKYESSEEVAAFFDVSIEQFSSSVWGELQPLSQTETTLDNPYPIYALPQLAKDAVLAISEYVQAPIAMTAQCVIGAMSHIAQAHVNAPHSFSEHGEPCSLFLLTEGQSGSRKSTCRNLADKAIKLYELKQYDIYI